MLESAALHLYRVLFPILNYKGSTGRTFLKLNNTLNTRMHSSRMRTVRNSSRLPGGGYLPGGCTCPGKGGGGVPARGGCTCQGGVPAQGGYLPGGGYTCLGGIPAWGCTWQGVPAWGVPAQGAYLLQVGGGYLPRGCTWQGGYLPRGYLPRGHTCSRGAAYLPRYSPTP